MFDVDGFQVRDARLLEPVVCIGRLRLLDVVGISAAGDPPTSPPTPTVLELLLLLLVGGGGNDGVVVVSVGGGQFGYVETGPQDDGGADEFLQDHGQGLGDHGPVGGGEQTERGRRHVEHGQGAGDEGDEEHGQDHGQGDDDG